MTSSNEEPHVPRFDELFAAVVARPAAVDELIQPFLNHPALPKYLNRSRHIHQKSLSRRPRFLPEKFADCLIVGLISGRAYALLSTPIRPPKSLSDLTEFPFRLFPAELRLQICDEYEQDRKRRAGLFRHMRMESDPGLNLHRKGWHVGYLYVKGIQILLCGNALKSSLSSLRRFYNDVPVTEDPEHWWETFKNHALDEMRPCENDCGPNEYRYWRRWSNDPSQRSRKDTGFHNSVILELFRLASEHLRTGERDWSPEEIVDRLWRPLVQEGSENIDGI